jgi:[1-hydroxy-2-(trimethylamino)ethyl]phosphonate dioxygenase
MPERVLVVSIDGLAPRFITPSTMPSLCSLARSGASCFTARTIVPPLTVPAHASMFRGVDPATHGLVDNTPVPPRCNAPSFLAAARAAGLTTASVICWPPMDLLVEPHASQYRVSLDSGYDPHDDDVVTGETIDLLRRRRPDVTLTYLVGTDLAGHALGWGSEEYLAAAARIDVLLADLVGAAGPGSAILVTTDHGGADRGHFEPVDDILESFVVARSARIAPASMWAHASILDIAPTVADLAGVDAADEWIGASLVGGEHAIVDHLLRIIATMGEHSYGERVDMLEHSLQTAACARAAGETDSLVLAALLHDIGHVIGHDRAGAWGLPDHAEVGARYLQQWLPPDVVEPIRRHIAAKRYLVATDPSYRDQLSDASIESLREQGGPFSDEEALGFSIEPFADEAVALRRHDDDGKVDGLDVAPRAEYRELLTRFVSADVPGAAHAPARPTAT